MSNWRSEAKCIGTPVDVFFPADDFSHPEMTELQRTAHDTENLLRARLICSGCVVRTACLQHAIEAGEEHGVLGGLTPTQRRYEFTRPTPGRRSTTVEWFRHSKGASMVRDFSGGSSLAEVAARYDTKVRTVVREVSAVIASP